MINVLAHYGEIALKGKNRVTFEKILLNNIYNLSKLNNINLSNAKKEDNRLILSFDYEENEINKIIINDFLNKIFGLKNFSFYEEAKKDKDDIKEKIVKLIKELNLKNNFKTFSFKTKRADKTFELTSPELNNFLRKYIETKTDFKINYKKFDKQIFIEIDKKRVFIYLDKFELKGGLPVGSSGKGLSLISGGIDSPISSYLIMKRGVKLIYFHIYDYETEEEFLDKKIPKIVKMLNLYQGKSKIYAIKNKFFKEITKDIKFTNYRVLLFKYFLLNLADLICEKEDIKLIVTGDSLGQVSSQTIENLLVQDSFFNKLILRPLITYDKEEIINLSKELGFYDLSIEEYKDSCAFQSKKVVTKGSVEKLKKIIDEYNIDEKIKEVFKNNLEVYNI